LVATKAAPAPAAAAKEEGKKEEKKEEGKKEEKKEEAKKEEKKEDKKPEAEKAEQAPTSGLAVAALPSKCECKFEDFCTCDGVLGYLDCISKKCASADCDCHPDQFEASCANVGNMCNGELDFTCTMEKATCKGKFHQLPNSVTGITVDTDALNQRSYCGPFGRCQGSVDAKVHVSHGPEDGGGVVQCHLQRYEGAKDFDGKGWEKCEAGVDKNGDATCSMKMPETLKPGAALEGKCVYAAYGATRLKQHRLVKQTKEAWWQVSNKYGEAPAAPAAKKEEKKKEKESAEKSGAWSLGASLTGFALLLAVTDAY